MSLFDVEHQATAQSLLQRAIGSDRVPHGYLFHGPDGVGKEMFARGLAALLLCEDPVETTLEGVKRDRIGVEHARIGCGTCRDCQLVAAGTHPDLHLVYRQLNREHPDPEVRKRKALDIGVDVLRHFVIDRVGLTPNRGRAKVYVIREADRATVQAQNALLKTLEEPPGNTVIILLVTSLDRLLATTLSRCQLVRFDALPTAFVRSKLAALSPQLPDAQITWYADNADGSIGRAHEWADDDLYNVNARMVQRMSGLAESEPAGGRRERSSGDADDDSLAAVWIDEAKSLSDRYKKRDPDITDTEATRRALKSMLQLAANWFADILRAGSGGESAIVNSAHAVQVKASASAIDAKCAAQAINRIAQTERQLDLNVNTQLAVETLLNDLARLSQGQRALAV
ncbi:MAG: DNA polymerase III subunit [Phycisphaerae bacterium]